jgi:hypothetical protein
MDLDMAYLSQFGPDRSSGMVMHNPAWTFGMISNFITGGIKTNHPAGR